MAGMKRFVTYIYSYEDKKKSGNAGFAKIEIRGEECRIEVHLRGIYTGKNDCRVYLFREDAGDIVGFPLGEMPIANGNGDFGTRVKAGNIGESSFGIFEMDGLVLVSEDDRLFLSRWKEDVAPEVGMERFRVWEAPGERAADTETPAGLAQSMPASSEGLAQSMPASSAAQQTFPSGKSDVLVSVKSPERPAARPEPQQKNVTATEIPMRNIFPDYDWHIAWEKLTKVHPVFAPFREEKAVCVQIELRELRELPKRYWYLGNNSFLLHGFFNYRYLIIGKTKEERWFIGVPGIYQRQERVMAAIFGFPEFMETAVSGEQPSREGDASWSGEEGELINHFGCWFRYIEE